MIRTACAVAVALQLAAMPAAANQDRPAPDRAGRHYLGRSAAACAVIDYGCPTGWAAFEDAAGCGCAAPAVAALPKSVNSNCRHHRAPQGPKTPGPVR